MIKKTFMKLFPSSLLESSNYHVTRGYHYCTTSFIKAWTQVLRSFKSCSRRVGDSRWWRSLTMLLAGNKAPPFVGQLYHKNNSSSSSSPYLPLYLSGLHFHYKTNVPLWFPLSSCVDFLDLSLTNVIVCSCVHMISYISR